MKRIVQNRVMVMTNGDKHDAPDAPVVYSCEPNPDGTWTIEDGEPNAK